MTTQSRGRELDAIRSQLNVLGIAEGFFQSRVLFALMKLDIFEIIGEGDRSAEEIAVRTGAKAETLIRLLNAGVVIKLLHTADTKAYSLTPASRSVLLRSAGATYLGDWISNLGYFDVALSGLHTAVLESAPTVDVTGHFGGDPEQTREFILAMHDYASLRGKELAQYLDTAGCSSLLDLGCGHGAYAFQLGAANPKLKLFLLDSAGVLEVAKDVRGRYAIANEVSYIPADAVKDEVPGTYDIILISNTLHALGPEASLALLKRLYRSVNPGGSVVIQAQFLRDDRLGERWPVLLDLTQLCLTSAGANHSVRETMEWFEKSGFSPPEFRSMGVFNTNSFVRAWKIRQD
jgi:SAM-dependent methyltransferase